MEHVTKVYPGVVALDDVSMGFSAGEVHALVGENGAGKSTLIKIIAGAATPEAGSIVFDGTAHLAMTPKLSRGLGIEVIYQEYNLIETLSAAENICLGQYAGFLVDFKAMERKAQTIFDEFGIRIDPKTTVYKLSSAQKQIVEIAKALSKDVRVLVMDEPTSSITVNEVDTLMDIIGRLKARGVTIIYISHRLDEVFRIADRVSVLRDGKYVGTNLVADIDRPELIRMMVGRDLSENYPVRERPKDEVVMEVRGLTGSGVEGVSFSLHRGEILGIAGLVGSGRTEVARLIYGADRKDAGEVLLNDRPAKIDSEKDAIDLGVGLIPEDRKLQGCFLEMDVKWNVSIQNIRKLCRFGVVNRKKEVEQAAWYRDALRIKTPSLSQQVRNLSGGNQQKIVVAKTLAANTDIIVFDEPTRGIDVNAKHEIYLLMTRLVSEGKAIIMITSDMEELFGMADRTVVLCEGRQAGIVERQDFDQARILELASGVQG